MTYQRQYFEAQPAGITPGARCDSGKFSGRTRTASIDTPVGCAVQLAGDGMCSPLLPGGSFGGIAAPARLYGSKLGEMYVESDNVPVEDEGRFWHVADTVLAEGDGLNWNWLTQRWTNAAPGGNVVAVKGAEADTAASGIGSVFKLRLRRVR
jgi:hypothetical protein